MAVHRLEHFFVLTDDVEATKRFYSDVLGFSVGFRPQLGFAGYWLYAGDVPCVHVGERRGYERFTAEAGIPMSARAPGTGPVDHVAFNASGFDETKARLDAAGVSYQQNALDDIGLRQIFVEDPNGITIELNFRAEASG